MGDPEELLFLYALQNAVRHGSAPQVGTVIGAVMGSHPELRTRAREVASAAPAVVAEVAAMEPGEREARLRALAPELMEEISGGPEKREGLPDLDGAEDGVVMRFAPNPSGPLHLGHARAAILNDEYVRRYGGEFVLRIEDTDPRRVDPDAYGMLWEDVEWLGLGVTRTVYQSDRMEVYHEHARRLIDLGAAYVCTCLSERFRELKLERRACPCRNRSVDENITLWERMHAGEFPEGGATLRLKTDLAHPDPAMRDFSLFRIVTSVYHPRIEATVYPLMNFSVAVDDHLLGITHVIRGKDHIANTRRQQFIFEYFGWPLPVYIHYGRMSISGLVLSTSAMREGIARGEYDGWDDVRLGTLRAIGRRGIRPGAVREAMVDIGTGETDISFSWENLYARNRTLVDPEANRYFFVPDPVELEVRDAPRQVARAPLYPRDPDRGYRTLVCEGRVMVPAAELEGHDLVRLKDLYNVRISREEDTPVLTYAGDALDDARREKAPIIQWLPPGQASPCTLRHPDGEMEGLCEARVADELDQVIQFERVGFCRVDAVDSDGIVVYWAHR
ncbi:MAG: glutamate--tRNA ligase [Methanomicrobiales archaeon]